ncbi:MAG: hypothetical protein GQ570_11225 [Helicobacteraceae bacterium]|nr:hypothetical protein [Helicobacteraceae bacterium]
MKSMIKNALGNTTKNIYVPCDAVNAETFASEFLDGTYKVYESLNKVGTDNAVTTAYQVNLQFSDSTTGRKGYLDFIAKETLDTEQIGNTLKGLTIDGVTIDTVSVFTFSPLTFA